MRGKVLLSVSIVVCVLSPTIPLLFGEMKELKERLADHVLKLSEDIGERNSIRYTALNRAAGYIEETLKAFGYHPERQVYFWEGREYRNIIATRTGNASPEEIIVIGAHYDTVTGTPGADDNASGVAGLLELARTFQGKTCERTLQWVGFTNEEPPFFRTRHMGSRVFAKRARAAHEKIVAMLCLEMIGYFAQEQGSQEYPLPFMKAFYPDQGDFISVVGNLSSRSLVKQVAACLKNSSEIGVESIATFSWVPGVDFSDHYSFYREGYRAVMITDTAFYRNSRYHRADDRVNTLDYASMAQVVTGLREVVLELAGGCSEDLR
jgi:Zn-dependent M28 family amino/carboxypeptidase